jgi:hypothetical protein
MHMETHNESEGFRGNQGRDCGSIQETKSEATWPVSTSLYTWLGLCIDCALRSNDCAMRSTLLQ